VTAARANVRTTTGIFLLYETRVRVHSAHQKGVES